MKIRRHKHTKRVLKFFKTNYGYDISKQVNVLVDGTFAHEALDCKINLADQMPKFFDLKPKNCRLLTTKCAVRETELLGKPTYGAMLILKQYEQVPCRHKREYVNAEKCFKTIITHQIESRAETPADKRESKYFIATQSESLKDFVRSSKGVPLVLISHNAINLEKPSEASFEHVTKATEIKLQPKADDISHIQKLKERLGVRAKTDEKHLHRHRKAKGPNPLSCLKKKKNPSAKPANRSNKSKTE